MHMDEQARFAARMADNEREPDGVERIDTITVSDHVRQDAEEADDAGSRRRLRVWPQGDADEQRLPLGLPLGDGGEDRGLSEPGHRRSRRRDATTP